MKKIIIIIIISIAVISISICGIQNAINLSFEKGWLTQSWTTGDFLNYYASTFVAISTIILGIIAIWQTSKANELSMKLLNNELLENNCFINLEPKLDISIKHNEDTKITMSAHHKLDNGATIAIENNGCNDKSFNEYYFKLYFKDNSKTSIKDIKISSLICVQDPSKDGGMYWEDGTNDPIPVGLKTSFDDKVQLNWISNNEFYTHLKIYSPKNGCFSNMIENKINSCLMFDYTITSITNVQTKIQFKIWFNTDLNGKTNVIHANTNILEDASIKKI